MRTAAALLLTLLWTSVAIAQNGHGHDNNAQFRAPDVDVGKWVERLENPNRDVIAHRDGVIAALGLKPGQHVADVGAGTGPYMAGIARIVGAEGHYYGVDIAPAFIAHMRDRAAEAGLGNVTLIVSRSDSATLPAASVDVIVSINAYHHFGEIEPMLASLHRALKPGGRLIIVDFDRVEGTSRQWILDHIRADKTTFRGEIEAAGFRFVEEVTDTGLIENFFFRFDKAD
jgi:ubiquinone/menaquinone biosynthesis C-methylase UbiE